ncbi:MAG: protein kinase domain-containing protein [Desulfosudaceae bacterium]
MTPDKNTPGRITTSTLLDYFMLLYKTNLGVSRQTPSAIIPVETSRSDPRLTTYDLQVTYREKTHSRRITLGPIAAEAGSKSQCFFAIYDTKLVIKIPPQPITDFSKYIRHIERDRRIAQTLSPRVCLIPGVGMILDKVHKFPRNNDLKEERRENIYYEWLHYNPEYQYFLKINGQFAFFMDLARYMFLSEAFHLFHSRDDHLQKEILRDPSILDNFDRFEGRYGTAYTSLGMDLKETLQAFDSRAGQLLEAGIASSSWRYKTQEWFFSFLAEVPLQTDEEKFPAHRLEEVHTLLEETAREHQPVIDDYRKMIRTHLQKTNFSRQKYYKAGVIANLLEMLAWLHKKGVAIRDIKPDNLLMAGNPDNYPMFLSVADQFSIGLIDFETAVICRPDAGNTIEQPLLGGTSFYATPLHLFTNKILKGIYGELTPALYLQDWYALAAMIYRLITGKYLFVRAAERFLAIPAALRQSRDKGRPAEVINRSNRVFWQVAVAEFTENTRRAQSLLRAIRPPLMPPVTAMLRAELASENNRLNERVKRRINGQNLITRRQNREKLYRETPDNLLRLAGRAAAGPDVDAASATALKVVAALRRQQEQNEQAMARLRRPDPELSALELVHLLFYRVVNFADTGRGLH